MTTPITPEPRETYDELRALHQAATPPPWEVTAEDWATISSGPDAVIMAYAGEEDCLRCGEPTHGAPEVIISVEDAALIAAMRNALPGVLDALDTAEAERDEAWRVASQQTRLERDRAESAETALADATRRLDAVRAEADGHPDPRCGIHPDDDPVTCGWKSAYAGILDALDQEATR